MEIPYIVNPRKDTGLNNSKIAIWLFLASEVMLFGGLFSSYIFLRIYADYPWPERALPVLPGLVNTFILIASSVTVVFAWASLKLRNWKGFVGYMSFTIFCALVFMVLKGFEYNAKFHHQAVQYKDWTNIEGHVHPESDGHAGGNFLAVNSNEIYFDLGSYHGKYLDEIFSRIEDYQNSHGDRITFLKQVQAELIWKERTKKLQAAISKSSLSEEEVEKENEILTTIEKYFKTLNYLELSKARRVTSNHDIDSNLADAEKLIVEEVSLISLEDLIANAKETLKADEDKYDFKAKTLIKRAVKELPKYSDENRLAVYEILKTNGYAVMTAKEDLIINEFQDDKLIQNPVIMAGDAIKLDGEGEGSLRYILAVAKESFIESRKHNEKVKEAALRQATANVKNNVEGRFNEVADLSQYETARKDAVNNENTRILESGEFGTLVTYSGALNVVVDNAEIKIAPKWGRMSNAEEGKKSAISLLDKTVISGVAGDSGIILHVDAVDHRHLVMKARHREYSQEKIDGMIEDWYKNLDDSHGAKHIKDLWVMHKKWRTLYTDYLAQEYGKDDNGEPKRVPTDVELYRITWSQFVAYKAIQDNKEELTLENVIKHTPGPIDGFTGANHKKFNTGENHSFPELKVARKDMKFESVFSPKMNNYYAIYFTVTGLHGLHVIGGALVLSYYLFFGYGMYKTNPEWLANRVEVGGLFWHFVDLVWIFVFPIFYLM